MAQEDGAAVMSSRTEVSTSPRRPPPPPPPKRRTSPRKKKAVVERAAAPSPGSARTTPVTPASDADAAVVDEEARAFEDELGGQYAVHRRIGEGTFSRVYLASPRHDPSARVALKRIVPISSPSRVLNEIRALETLGGQHHVVPLLSGVRNGDTVTLVLPYFGHEHFRSYYRRMEETHARQYMRALLEALAHLHRHGIIHRDIKPSNFLHSFGDGSRYLLVDFGLSERVGPVEGGGGGAAGAAGADGGAGTTPDGNTPSTPRTSSTPAAGTTRGTKRASAAAAAAAASAATENGGVEKRPRFKRPRSHAASSAGAASVSAAAAFPSARPPASAASSVAASAAAKATASSASAAAAAKHRGRKGFTSRRQLLSQLKLMPNPSSAASRAPDAPSAAAVAAVAGAARARRTPLLERRAVSSAAKGGRRARSADSRRRAASLPAMPTAKRAGTRGFRAPEVLMRSRHQTVAIDVWSAGVVLLCIMSRRYPFFTAKDDLEALGEIMALVPESDLAEAGRNLPEPRRVRFDRVSGARPDWKTLCGRLGGVKWSDEAYDFLGRCLAVDPGRRITAEEALAHPFLRGVAM